MLVASNSSRWYYVRLGCRYFPWYFQVCQSYSTLWELWKSLQLWVLALEIKEQLFCNMCLLHMTLQLRDPTCTWCCISFCLFQEELRFSIKSHAVTTAFTNMLPIVTRLKYYFIFCDIAGFSRKHWGNVWPCWDQGSQFRCASSGIRLGNKGEGLHISCYTEGQYRFCSVIVACTAIFGDDCSEIDL